MKRTIKFMQAGITNEHAWHLVVFAATFDAKTSTLYDECSKLYDKDVYDMLKVGMTITVK
jgi:hypothetical protein